MYFYLPNRVNCVTNKSAIEKRFLYMFFFIFISMIIVLVTFNTINFIEIIINKTNQI